MKKLSYEKFIEICEEEELKTRFNCVSFFIGYHGKLEKYIYDYIMLEYEKGYLKA